MAGGDIRDMPYVDPQKCPGVALHPRKGFFERAAEARGSRQGNIPERFEEASETTCKLRPRLGRLPQQLQREPEEEPAQWKEETTRSCQTRTHPAADWP